MILHLCLSSDWEKSQTESAYHPGSLNLDGFIHCSQPEQILDVANRYYPGEHNLVLLWIDLDRLQPKVRWEFADGEDFPHVYGPINMDAIRAVTHFAPNDDGRFRQFPYR